IRRSILATLLAQSSLALLRRDERTIVLDHALKRLPGQVQAVEIGIVRFELGQYTDGLGVVVEAAEVRHACLQRRLPRMSDRRMAQVMCERQRLGEILVCAQGAGERAGDLSDLEGMGEARAVKVALVSDEHLRLALEPAEGRGVDDPVAVALKRRAR